MTDLYHLHLKGVKEHKWKENIEIIINNDFTNRLGSFVNNFNDCTNNKKLDNLIIRLKELLNQSGYKTFDKMPLILLLDYMLEYPNTIDRETKKIILNETRELVYNTFIIKRELAMESFRKDNNANLPSRLHCLYATNEKGIDYWAHTLMAGDINDIDVYRIETLEEPFKTNEIFIPNDSFNFQEVYKNSYEYWNPNFKDVNEETSEYLVTGKVKILEKVAEIKKQ